MAAKKSETVADFFDKLAAWMRENGCENPREVPDAVVEALKAGDE